MNKIKNSPIEGVYVSASYIKAIRRSSFRARLLNSGETLAHRNFRSISTSPNVMAFIGLCEALKYCSKNSLRDVLIYSNNLTAIAWCKNKKHGSKVLDKRTQNDVNAGIGMLRANDFSERIHFWDTARWGEPSFSEMIIDDELPF